MCCAGYIGIKKNQHVKVIFFLICRLEFVQCIVSYFKMSHIFLKIECPIGYYRSNCSEACKFSHFGKECQDKCNCSPHLSDHITGCYGMSHAYSFKTLRSILTAVFLFFQKMSVSPRKAYQFRMT